MGKVVDYNRLCGFLDEFIKLDDKISDYAGTVELQSQANASAEAYRTIRKLADDLAYEPVVNCQDCLNWDLDWYPNKDDPDCRYCAMVDMNTSGDFYCANGERLEDC